MPLALRLSAALRCHTEFHQTDCGVEIVLRAYQRVVQYYSRVTLVLHFLCIDNADFLQPDAACN